MMTLFRYAYLLLAISAAALCASSSASDEARSLLAELNRTANLIAPGQVYKMLKRVLELDRSQEEAANLIKAYFVNSRKCTLEHQQWLISQQVNCKGTPLNGYLQEIRDNYRKLCAKTFASRMALIKVEQEDIDTVGALAAYLPESKQFKENLYKLDGVPTDSLVGALKEYLSNGELTSGLQQGSTYERHIALEQLKWSCEQLLSSGLYDFLWTLKVIDKPAELVGSEGESLLWKTKVCSALQLDTFETELQLRYSKIYVDGRELLAKFTNLLHLPDDIWQDASYKLKRDAMEGSLDKLTSEFHFLSEDADEVEAAERVSDDLDSACELVLEKLGPLLWLVDAELKQELSQSSSIGVLKQARVCRSLPYAGSEQ